VLVVGSAVSLVTWMMADRLTNSRAQERLAVQAETFAGAVQRRAADVEAALRAVAGLFEASDTVSDDEYWTMLERIQYPEGLAGIAYAPRVAAEDLEEFIDEARVSQAEFSVFELDADGAVSQVTRRATYWPVRYFHPAEEVAPLGLDVASVPGRQTFIAEASRTGRTVTTPGTPVAIYDQTGYVVYQPVMGDDGTVTGLAVGPVLLDSLTRDAVPPALASSIEWSLLESAPEVANRGLVHVTSASIGGREWTFEVRPAPGSPILVEAWRPAAVLGLAGVVVTVVAALATFWYWRETQTRINLESAGALVSAKDRFVATVSHELRTPLAAVVGFSELLRDGSLEEMTSEERNEIVNTIAEQSRDLADIVEDLLVVARADHGTLATVAVPVDLAAQARQVTERLSCPGIAVLSPAAAARALADPGRVRQIIRNLLGNAVAYGGSEIVVSVHDGEDTVAIQIADDGDGVPAEEAERIFEAYHRVHGLGPTTGSLGLGLSVSRTLARHMAGDLTYSRRDAQTVFELRLPKSDDAKATENSRLGSASPTGRPSSKPGSTRDTSSAGSFSIPRT
jgi:signal transduction histidine kinase